MDEETINNSIYNLLVRLSILLTGKPGSTDFYREKFTAAVFADHGYGFFCGDHNKTGIYYGTNGLYIGFKHNADNRKELSEKWKTSEAEELRREIGKVLRVIKEVSDATRDK